MPLKLLLSIGLLVSMILEVAIADSMPVRSTEPSTYRIETLSNLKFKVIENSNLTEIGITASIVEDDQGFMWLVGDRGVARYDGSKVRIFKNEPGNLSSIPPRLIKGMIKGASGRLWLFTENGLFLYSAEREAFELIEIDLGTTRQPAIGTVDVARDGSLWLGFLGLGFARYTPSSGGLEYYHDPAEVNAKPLRNYVGAIAEDKNGLVWLGTRKGVITFDPVSKKYENYSLKNSELAIGRITKIYAGHSGTVWVGAANGLFRYIKAEDRFSYYGAAYPGFLDGQITEIVEDSLGELWVAKLGGDIARYNSDADTFSVIQSRPNDPSSIVNSVLLMFAFNEANELWLGYYPSGGAIFDPHASAIETYVRGSSDETTLTHSTINSLVMADGNQLWVATDGGVSLLNLETGTAIRYSHKPDDTNSLSSDSAHSILYDSSQRLWVGTWLGGLNMLDAQGRQYTRYRHQPDSPNSINDDVVWAIAERNSSSMWVGTRKGLSILDIKSGQFEVLSYSDREVRGLHHLGEQYLLVQHLNEVVILNKSTLAPVSIRAKGWSALAPVNDTFVNEKGEVWFATSKGIKFWKGMGKPVRDFTSAGKQSQIGYFQIIEDETGLVWLGSDFGITSFNRLTGKFTGFSVDHGLPGNSFTHANTTARLPGGKLAMGSTKGLAIFNPKKTYLEAKASRSVLTELSVLDVTVDGSAEGGPIDKSILLADRVVLNHDQRVFSIKYTALDFQQSKNAQFEFQLHGFDKSWRKSGAVRSATYTNLDPGSYQFEVRAANDRDLWSTESAVIEVTILPPWWLTWWAYSFYALSILSLLSLILYVFWSKQQHEREHKLNEKLQEVDVMKDEFLANTSHELRTPLHGIISLSDIIMADTDDTITERKKESLLLINSSARRLSSLINDILDFSKLKQSSINLSLESLDLNPILNDVIGLTIPLIQDKPLRLVNNMPSTIALVYADLNRIQQIFHNLIGNAIKFTEQGSITITAAEEGGSVVISIADSGIGIPQEKLSSVFSQFEQVDGSIERKYGGTGLGLAVTKQLVELHKGHIWVTSELGGGTVFYFDLPIFNSDSPRAQVAQTKDPIVASTERAATNQVVFNRAERNRESIIETFKNTAQESIKNNTKHILVVDDEMVNRRVLEDHLSVKEFTVTTCKNGTEALILFEMEEFSSVSLILLDVMMPDISGLDVCKKIRAVYRTNQLPIIFLTAKSGVKDIENGYDAGGSDYLKKPFSKTELLLRMDLHLELRGIYDHMEDIVKSRTEELEQSNKHLIDSNNALVDLQGKLVQSEKMSSLGILVSGVGHEINNPVNFINASAHNLQLDIEDLREFIVGLAGDDGDDEILEDFTRRFQEIGSTLTDIDVGVGRVNGVVNNLRTFSRSGGDEVEKRKICDGIESTISLVKARYKSDIQFKSELSSDPVIACNASEMNQVIMNLLVNACHAMMADSGNESRVLSIKTFCDNGRLVIEVQDNGIGMSTDTMTKIFDPFFTTKSDGEGTGLGLSISHGIVRRHGGDLSVTSDFGRGTTFKVSIPLCS